MNTEPELEELVAINAITEKVIGCAIEVHKQLGPGLLEQTYEVAMCVELAAAGVTFVRQAAFPVIYKGAKIGEQRADLIVENAVVVELKSVDRYDPIFMAQVLTYLRCTGLRVGLLINFNNRVLHTGIRRFIL
jgi:GxxExxY protein